MSYKLRLRSVESLVICTSLIGAVYTGASFFYNRSDLRRVADGANLGYLKPGGPDIRVRGENEGDWNHVFKEMNVYRNDRVFTGAKSTATVSLKGTQSFTVEPNSLVKITDETDRTVFNLDSGSFFGELKKGARLIIKSKGQTTEIKSEGAAIRLESGAKALKLVVLKGEADVQNIPDKQPQLKGGDRKAASSDEAPPPQPTPEIVRVVANEQAEIAKDEAITVKRLTISLIQPAPSSTVWTSADEVSLVWKTEGDAEKKLKLEVSDDPLFGTMIHQESTRSDQAKVSLKPGVTYFWRVRSANGVGESPVSSFSVYDLQPPTVPNPSTLTEPTNWRGEVERPIHFEWSDPSLSDSYVVELSRTEDFSRIDGQEETVKREVNLSGLKAGVYYWRVKSLQKTRASLVSKTSSLTLVRAQTPTPSPAPTPSPTVAPTPQPVVAAMTPTPSPAPTSSPLPQPSPTPMMRLPLSASVWSAAQRNFQLEDRQGAITPYPGYSLVSEPTLSWLPVKGVTYYRIEISDERSFKKLRESAVVVEPQWRWRQAKPGGYYARVIAHRSDNDVSEDQSISTTLKINVILTPPLIDQVKVESVPNQSASLILRWSSRPFGVGSEVQISDNKDFSDVDSLRTSDSRISTVIVVPGRKYIRVRNVDESGHAISPFSDVKIVDVQPWLKPETSPPLLNVPIALEHPFQMPKVSLHFGLGVDSLTLSQTGSDLLSSAAEGARGLPSYELGLDIGITSRSYLEFSYEMHQSQFAASDGQPGHSYDERSIEASYWFMAICRTDWQLWVRGGLGQQTTPLLTLDSNLQSLLLTGQLTTANVGLEYRFSPSPQWEYRVGAGYEQSLGAKGDQGIALNVRSPFIYDLDLGIVRHLNEHVALGLRWRGQGTRFDYDLNAGGAQSSGLATSFDSRFGLQLDYGF